MTPRERIPCGSSRFGLIAVLLAFVLALSSSSVPTATGDDDGHRRLQQLERELKRAREAGNEAEVRELRELITRLRIGTTTDDEKEQQVDLMHRDNDIIFEGSGLSFVHASRFGQLEIAFNGRPAPPPSSTVCGFSLVADRHGPQIALMQPSAALVVSVRPGEEVTVSVPIRAVAGRLAVTACAELFGGEDAEMALSLGGHGTSRVLSAGKASLEVSGSADAQGAVVRITTAATSSEAAVRWSHLRVEANGDSFEIPFSFDRDQPDDCPPRVLPVMRPAIEQALVEWDWRMQDGLDTPREPSTYAAAVEKTFQRGEALISHLQSHGVPLEAEAGRWTALWAQWRELGKAGKAEESVWEDLWRRVHLLRRQIALENPLAQVGPLLFVKQVPGIFSHQLTQYYGRYARPGGGIFVLDAPGQSMRCRQLAQSELPLGSYQHPEVSYDGEQVLFAFCRVETTPRDFSAHADCFYHLYRMAADGSDLRQLTDGPFDDFTPRYLPDGKIVFISTRGFGHSRCGPAFSPAYKLTVAEADGSHPRLISFHETHEWDPAVLSDGRLIYTRWDYVDRNAAHYQHLWSTHPDGSHARIVYGNNTFNPMGTWEARPVPGSARVMATAGAHHAMTAGSIVLVDVTRGVDGLKPLLRLTPDAPFPESESEVEPAWHAPAGDEPRRMPAEAVRWPGHCYRSAYPLSEEVFLAAYSFDRLILGEERASVHPANNMFGIYLVDRFGNKELLYRDLNISSLWPVPLRPRLRPPLVPEPPRTPELYDPDRNGEGTFLLQDVYASNPRLPEGAIKALRIVEVLPKSTPYESDPWLGLPTAAPGKQVLGTVPVEQDGSAYFHAPAGVPLMFQALDEQGQAVQMMRSVTYLQPGETVSCIGCHEHRLTAPPRDRMALALRRTPSTIQPGPDGSNPLSYPILVQPVLDEHCVRCHNPRKPEGDVVLTGDPREEYTASYCALAPLVSTTFWQWQPGWKRTNSEPLTMPGHFGARGSRLTRLLRKGHGDVQLQDEEWDRLVTWMDANALFYGTFDPADQKRQRRGERIEAPKLQ